MTRRCGSANNCDRRLISRWLGTALVLMVTVLPCVSWGRKSGHSVKEGNAPRGLMEQASSLRQRGTSAIASKDFVTAYELLAQSFRLAPEAQTLYQLGRLAWQSGRTVSAQDLMRRYLADPSSGGDPAARKDAEQILEQPRPASGEVTIFGERGALVLVDERVVGMLPLPLPILLASGDHRVTIEAADKRSEGPVKVLPGRLSELRFNSATNAVVSRVIPAVVWLPTWQGVPSAAQRLLQQILEQGVQRQKLSAVPKGIALAQAPRLADCLDQLDCLDKLAAVNEADYVLVSNVEATGDLMQGDWTLRLSLVDSTTGDYAGQLTQSCSRCTTDKAGTMLDETLSRLFKEGTARPRGSLEVLSSPAGADVLLTERKLGQTPYQRAAFVGSYPVVVKQSGYKLHSETITVTEGKKAVLKAELLREGESSRPAPPPLPPSSAATTWVPSVLDREPRPLWRIALGASAIGVGVLIGGFGVSGLIQDGKCADPLCQTYFDTRNKGVGLLVAGGVLAIGGSVLLALPGTRRPRTAFHLTEDRSALRFGSTSTSQ